MFLKCLLSTEKWVQRESSSSICIGCVHERAWRASFSWLGVLSSFMSSGRERLAVKVVLRRNVRCSTGGIGSLQLATTVRVFFSKLQLLRIPRAHL